MAVREIIVCFLVLDVFVVKSNQLPVCLKDSVCAMVQANPAGVSAVPVCRCPSGTRCDDAWDRAVTRERRRWLRHHLPAAQRELITEEQFKYCANSSTLRPHPQPTHSLSDFLPRRKSSSSSPTEVTSPQIVSSDRYCTADDTVAYTSYEFRHHLPRYALDQDYYYDDYQDHQVAKLKNRLRCSCPPGQVYARGPIKVVRIYRGLTVMATAYSCEKMPLCEQDSILFVVTAGEQRGGGDGPHGLMVDTKCRCPRGKRCHIDHVAVDETWKGPVYSLYCSIRDS